MTKELLFVIAFTFAVNVVSQGQAEDRSHHILFKTETVDTSKAPAKSPAKSVVASQSLSDNTSYVVLQFKDAIKPSQKKKLSKLGVAFLNYIPNNAYVVRVAQRVLPIVTHFPFIQWVGDYKSSYKKDPALKLHEALREDKKIKINIRLFKNEESRSLRLFILKNRGTVLYSKDGIVTAEVQRVLIDDLAERQEVSWIEEAREPELIHMQVSKGKEAEDGNYDELTGYESGVKIIKASAAYAAEITGENQIVAVADTGLDVGEISTSLSNDFQRRVLSGHALGFFSTTWADAMGHGTHVAGSILGLGEYSLGKLAGVAYDAKLIVQSLAGPLAGLAVPPHLSDLFGPAYREGARIHSNSWGIRSRGQYDQYAKSLDEFIWEHPDMIVVMAAGNSGQDANKDGVIDANSLLSPAIAKNCITVGATENTVFKGGVQKSWGELRMGPERWSTEPIASDKVSDSENGIAAFSSRGPTFDHRIKPDVVAPGTNILSARSHHPKAVDLWGKFNEHYVWSGGTSMSTPIVSGAAALVRQYYEDVFGLETISAALIKATLMNGADDLYPGQFGFGQKQEMQKRRPNIHEGWGRVNVEQSLFDDSRPMQYIDDKIGVQVDQAKSYKVQVMDEEKPLSVTLVYTDFPGASQARSALVNDIDLELVTPKGEVLYPNGLNKADRDNNAETIDIQSPRFGVYEIRVKGHNIPSGNKYDAQPFAVVVSGGLK